jgi:8-oxo-dGTP pyrophosphatase MutT (NUDIX family)
VTEGFRHLGEKLIHKGYIFEYLKAEFEGPAGERFERDVIRHPGAVAALPVEGDNILLVRQYRPALDASLLEIPAGLREPGEDRLVTANRELEEEIGRRAGSLELLSAMHTAVGFTDEVITIYLATQLEWVELRADSVEEQYMEQVVVPVDQVAALISSGEITDSKTIVALLMYLQRLQ